jgi:hypothetical protein
VFDAEGMNRSIAPALLQGRGCVARPAAPVGRGISGVRIQRNIMVTKQALTSIIIVGGTDAPGIQLVPDGHGGWKIVRIPGWNPEAMVDLANGLAVISAASKLKAPGLAQQVINAVGSFVQKQIGEHAPGASVVVMH